jgi:plasmid stability protein
MPTALTLKNIPADLYENLKNEAKLNHRSINSEILIALRYYLSAKKSRPMPDEVIRMARQLRSRVTGKLSHEEIQKSINEGRE